jgi:cold-inducible RNA-binding protein
MSTKIYVENIAPTTTENELNELFSTYGNVAEVNMVVERTYGKPRGLGFVTMVTSEGARAAIQALHGKQIAEHLLTVTEVIPNKQRNGLSSPERKPSRAYRGMAGLAKLSLKGTS